MDHRQPTLAAIDIRNTLYSRALLDFVQLALAIWGMVEWQKARRSLASIICHFFAI